MAQDYHSLLNQMLQDCKADQETGRIALSLMMEIPRIQANISNVERDIELIKGWCDGLEQTIKDQNVEIKETISKLDSKISAFFDREAKNKEKIFAVVTKFAAIGVIALIFAIASISVDELFNLVFRVAR